MAKSEDIRIAYQTAIQLAIYDGNLSWTVTGIFIQFAILMVAGSIFPNFIGSTDNLIVAVVALFISFAGIIMTGMFGSMVMRIRTYEEYWILRANELESSMDDLIQTVTGSLTLSNQKNITVAENTVQMEPHSSVKSKHLLMALFILFLVTFSVLAYFNIYRVYNVITASPGTNC